MKYLDWNLRDHPSHYLPQVLPAASAVCILQVFLLCPQAKAAEAKERREAKAEAKNREGSAEKTEKVTF